MNQLLGPTDISDTIATLANRIAQGTADKPIAIVGIRSRGDIVAEKLASALATRPPLGVLDISLYRDDFSHRTATPKLQSTDLPFEVDGAHIILVDDVLFTGRTIRAALDAIYDYGRPAKVELAVLIDRGHRELPISADYVGHSIQTDRSDRVNVSLTASSESVVLVKK